MSGVAVDNQYAFTFIPTNLFCYFYYVNFKKSLEMNPSMLLNSL